MATIEQKYVRLTCLSFLWQCWRYYRRAREMNQGISYFTISNHGVPAITVMIAHGRKAWEVSQFATDYFAQR